MTIQNGVQCSQCGEEIFSNSRHDLVACECDDIFIDGGFDYIRVGFTTSMPVDVTREIDRETLPRYFRDEGRGNGVVQRSARNRRNAA